MRFPRIKRELLTRYGGLGAAWLLSRAMKSVEIKIAHYDRSVDPSLPDYAGRGVYVFWHEYISFPIGLWGNYNVAILVSQHRDADWLTHAARYLKFDVVRGSTTRGGSAALRQLKRFSETHNIVITPDGPKGPRREMAMGPIFLASWLQVPLIPVGFGFDKPWRFSTWDKFAIPRPGTRARGILGPRIRVPEKLDRDGMERVRKSAQDILNVLTCEAESWAEQGYSIPGELPFVRRRNKNAPWNNEIEPVAEKLIETIDDSAAVIPFRPLDAETSNARRARRSV